MKKNKFSKNWIIKQKRDIYVKQSKIEGYRSRAVYKLKEINDKFKFLKSGIQLVDLGAAPLFLVLIAKYVEIDVDEGAVSLETEDRMTALVANLPIKRTMTGQIKLKETMNQSEEN